MTSANPYPVNTSVEFRSGRYKGMRGTILRYAPVKHLENRGAMALVKLDDGTEHYCCRPQDLRLAPVAKTRRKKVA